MYTCNPNLEILGYAARALLENVNQDLIKPFLEEHNITTIDPDRWYKVQSLLDILNDIARSGDTMGNFVAIGMKGAELAAMPPEVTSLSFEEFMYAYGEISQSVYRGEGMGEVWVERVGETHFAVHMNVPHPDDLMYGLLFGYVRRFMPAHVSYTVYYDEDVPTREDGGAETIIHVTWDS